jgi:hypothetical protein
MRYISIILLFAAFGTQAQFDGAGGEPGSKSVHKDDASIVAWADAAEVMLGPVQINDTAQGYPTIGTSNSAVGPFDGSVLSLGDGGSVTLSFNQPIVNTNGYDFAIFENGFKVGLSYYLELAHVEVSTNGTDFVRFPSESLIDTSFQTNNFAYTDPERIKNLAGKHQAPYGTLFDLEELGIEEVSYIRIVDVVGCVNDSFGTRDSKGRIINDPWPTPFASSGFDLDAVAVVNGSLLSVLSPEGYAKANPLISNSVRIGNRLKLKPEWKGSRISCRDMNGRELSSFSSEIATLYTGGVYTVTIYKDNQIWVQRIIVY